MKRVNLSFFVSFVVFILSSASPAWGMGTSEKDYHDVQGKGNWTHTFDVSKLKPGQYNILVRARDVAGNTSYAGPYNVNVDPRANLPVSAVLIPTEGQRVGGDLNILGATSGGEGTNKVEIRLDNGPWQLVQGSAFWSYFWKTGQVHDGPHTVESRATDADGLTGSVTKVSFFLDREEPSIQVSKLPSGSLVAGNVNLEGTVSNPNLIQSLQVSLDGKKTFQDLGLGGDPNKPQRTWQLQIDTKKFKDGPLILWFKTENSLKSKGSLAYLLFIDNTPPKITLLSPTPTTPVHDLVNLVGKITAPMGLKTLTYRVGDSKPVAIPLVAGNPYFTVPADLTNVNSNQVQVSFDATDPLGNLGNLTETLKVDPTGGYPTLHLDPSLENAKLKAPVWIEGSETWEAGPPSVVYQLNQNPEVKVASGPVFRFELSTVDSGKNNLTVWPVDGKGRRGQPVTVKFEAALGAPQISVEQVVSSGKPQSFLPGLRLRADASVHLLGKVESDNPLKSLTWTVGSLTPVSVPLNGSSHSAPFDVNFTNDPPFGYVPIELQAIDAQGQKTVWKSFVWFDDFSVPFGPDGLTFPDSGQPLHVITPDRPWVGWFQGGKPASVTVQGKNSDKLSAQIDGQRIRLVAAGDGVLEQPVVVVTDDKGRQTSTTLGKIAVETALPLVKIESPVEGAWVVRQIPLKVHVEDGLGIAKVAASVDSGAHWTELANVSGTDWTGDLAALPGQAQSVLVRATDLGGEVSVSSVAVRSDVVAPRIVFAQLPAMPASPGSIIVAGRVVEDGQLVQLQSVVGNKVTDLPLGEDFAFEADPSQSISVRAKDAAGNTSQATYAPFAVVTKVDPRILLTWPDSKATGFSGALHVVGRVVGFAGSPNLTVGFGSGQVKPVSLDSHGWFSFVWDPKVQKDPSMHLLVTAGQNRNQVDTQLPWDPNAGRTMPGVAGLDGSKVSQVDFAGTLDGPGVAGWSWQMDNGATTRVNAASPGVFHLVVPGVAPGDHTLTVRGLDVGGGNGHSVTWSFHVIDPLAHQPSFDLPLGGTVLAQTQNLTGKLLAKVPLTKAQYQVFAWGENGGTWQDMNTQGGNKDTMTFSVPLDQSLPYGRLVVRVRFENADGSKTSAETWVHKIWPKKTAPDVAEGIRWNDARVDAQNKVDLPTGGTFPAVFYGRPIDRVSLDPSDQPLKLVRQGNLLLVSADQDGVWGPVKLIVKTVDGDVFKTTPLTFLSGGGGLVLNIKNPVNGDWVRNTLVVDAKASAPAGLERAEFSLNRGKSWTKLSADQFSRSSHDTLADLHLEIPLDSKEDPLPQGKLALWVRVYDQTGKFVEKDVVVDRDSLPPQFTLITPPENDKVIGKTTIAGTTKAPGGRVTKVEWSADGKTFEPAQGTNSFYWNMDFSSYDPLPEKFFVRVSDEAGNQSVQPVKFPVDVEARKPIVQIQTPSEGQVLRADFLISGMAFDYAGVKSIAWRLDGGEWQTIPVTNGFSIPMSLSKLTDNEHVVEIRATNIYGNVGNIVKRTFKISLAEPISIVVQPILGQTQRQNIVFEGASFDRNGISKVEISADNGRTWNLANLDKTETWLKDNPPSLATENFTDTAWRKQWHWAFNTRSLKDGTYSFLIRAVDGYGTVGISSALVAIDNTPPELFLSGPTDGEGILGGMVIEGRVSDNGILKSVTAELREIAGPDSSVPAGPPVARFDLPLTPTFSIKEAPTDLRTGWYNLRVEAVDSAGNTTWVARNVRWEKTQVLDRVDIYYPLQGETLVSRSDVFGRYVGTASPKKADLLVDGKSVALGDITPEGFFDFQVNSSLLSDGVHTVAVRIDVAADRSVVSEERAVSYTPQGPWVAVTAPGSGSYVSSRPWINGIAGWALAPLPANATSAQKDARNRFIDEHQPQKVEFSLDDGKTFESANGDSHWQFRLEDLGMKDGPLPILVRAEFRDGSLAYTRLYLTLDQTAPRVVILEPQENASFRKTLQVAGWSTDNYGLSSLQVALRPGNKQSYEIPSFIQGLYLDGDFWGATYWSTAVGLTFFNDNVKLQALIGQAPDGRFSGMVSGAKLIANVAQIPFSYILGPDWTWFSMSVGVGADFSYFSMGAPLFDYSQGVFLGSVLVQWEFAKISFLDNQFLRYISFYSEFTAWFISSDVSPTAEPKLSGGVRLGLF
jgi:hypothetical protein